MLYSAFNLYGVVVSQFVCSAALSHILWFKDMFERNFSTSVVNGLTCCEGRQFYC